MKILENLAEQFDEIVEGVMGGTVPTNQYADNKSLSLTKAYAIRPYITLSFHTFINDAAQKKGSAVEPIVSLSVQSAKESKNVYSAIVKAPAIEGGMSDAMKDLQFVMERYQNFI